MALVKFTSALKRFYPSLNELSIEVDNVNEVLEKIENHFPGIKGYLMEDNGSLRQHINIFVDGELIEDRDYQSDILNKKSEVFIIQALSGG